ncbi:molybdate ABC transporter substrate-binding protein [Actinomycetospora cinnamomea]|uniref:Molybdate transport system substrate-binding protein n=1 Tax=Actinomycetospora cinnamomea TaxID=663609 RepID=A0A2U1FLZ4_9PSEU|nr:molybdate ABC transporter substrate-binding protein [Actinomycetospora cinnamomea]PVZ13189.1 molybdate transport system substrate-binding protein [Actinomycetospora cinnamomea]
MTRPRTLVPTTLAAALLLGVAACGGASGEPQAAAGRTLTVSAAASLTDVYQELGAQFEQAEPGVTVRFNFGGSDTLAQQVVQGAPADVLATASTRTMQTAQQAGRIAGEPVTSATNRLQVAVPPGNPKGLAGLASLVGPQVTESVCAPAVPCGAATEAAERAAGITLDPVSEEQDVRAVLQRVITRNVDAGLVYVTDVRSADGQVQGLDFPEATAPGAAQSYLVGAVAGSPHGDLATRWIAFVTGPQGDAALRQAGFTVP